MSIIPGSPEHLVNPGRLGSFNHVDPRHHTLIINLVTKRLHLVYLAASVVNPGTLTIVHLLCLHQSFIDHVLDIALVTGLEKLIYLDLVLDAQAVSGLFTPVNPRLKILFQGEITNLWRLALSRCEFIRT
jgi:hypothetical protein